MTENPGSPFGIKVVRIPTWAMPILAVLAIAFVIAMSLLSLTLLVFLIPIIVIAAIAHRVFGFWSTKTVVDHEWTDDARHTRGGPGQVIEADYEVVEPPKKPRS